MAHVVLSVQPLSDDVSISVRQPIEKAFTGSSTLYAASSKSSLTNDYRWAFEQPGSKVQASIRWHNQFDTMFNLAYDDQKGVAGSLMKGVFDSLDRWCGIRNRVIDMHFTINLTDYNLATGDSVALQKRLLSLYVDGTKLTTDVREQIQAMRTNGDSLQSGVNALAPAAESLKGCWVDFAKEISKDEGSALDRGADWFGHLNKWSDLMDMCDNSLALCQLTLDRFAALRNHLDQLPALLDQLPTLCFDLYGNLLAGAAADVLVNKADLDAFGAKVLKWATECPTWGREDWTPRKKVRGGEVYLDRNGSRHNFGEDPNSVYVEREEDIQVGITRFDFDVHSTSGKWGPLSTRLNVGDPHRANRVWEKRNDEANFYNSKLSWIEIPSKLRERVQFSWTTLDFEGNDYRVFNPGMPEGRGKPIYSTSEGKRCTWWHVKFPKSYATDKVAVRPWIMDVFSQTAGSHIGVRLEVDEVSREGFRMIVLLPTYGWLQYIRIGYVAYEEGANIEGFHEGQDHLDVPTRNQNQPQNHSFRATYYAFPAGKFRRRPAAAAMLKMYWLNSHWNYRADTRLAVSRDGFVIQGCSWADTILCDLKGQVIAIANE
ncbi:hypothetical protein QBC46DRAFT_427489 [Diplogelasinospora grovesii]|uniref:Uncharacterized protein n=1 Tax=Diplogelasinospora grovesii TaxID=303347 RepID=A0AAN6MWM9_9PEZI|nr:hypothetical protein QBC46DRAFT_427489 [Diplogelasinospora grovesii]